MSERSVSRRAIETAYDIVVIGGGMAGLTSGALLAKAGKKVLVIDDQERPGGHANAIRQDEYTFDAAVHLITRCAKVEPFEVGLVDAVLRHLGVRERCEFLRIADPFYTVHFPDLTLSVPTGREAYLAAYLRHFPREERGLRRLVDLGVQIANELRDFPEEPGIFDLLRAPWRFPTLSKYKNATLQQVIDSELQDPRLKTAYATLWSWTGSPPWRASFLVWAMLMAHYVEGGAYYCRGGYQILANAVAEALKRAGGELVAGQRVTRILTRGRRVEGVVLDGGERITAPVVISAIDPRVTFGELLRDGPVPASLLRTLRRFELSLSVLAAYIATDLDLRSLDVGHENMYSTTWELDRMYKDALAGDITGVEVIVPTLTDPSLAPSGQHIVMLMATAPSDASKDQRLAEPLLSLAERLLPGLSNHITAVASVDPAEPQKVPIRRIDSMYGAAVTPEQLGTKRLHHVAPIRGLYLVGQWTQPGPGVPWVMESAMQVTRHVLGQSSVQEVLSSMALSG